MVNAVQLKAVGGEIDVAGVSEHHLLGREIGQLRQLLVRQAGGLVVARQLTFRRRSPAFRRPRSCWSTFWLGHRVGEGYASGSPRFPLPRRLRNCTSSATISATPRSLPSSS